MSDPETHHCFTGDELTRPVALVGASIRLAITISDYRTIGMIGDCKMHHSLSPPHPPRDRQTAWYAENDRCRPTKREAAVQQTRSSRTRGHLASGLTSPRHHAAGDSSSRTQTSIVFSRRFSARGPCERVASIASDQRTLVRYRTSLGDQFQRLRCESSSPCIKVPASKIGDGSDRCLSV